MSLAACYESKGAGTSRLLRHQESRLAETACHRPRSARARCSKVSLTVRRFLECSPSPPYVLGSLAGHLLGSVNVYLLGHLSMRIEEEAF